MDTLTDNGFVQNLFDQVLSSKNNTSNTFISPTSIISLLKLLELCSKGQTKEQIKSVVHSENSSCFNSDKKENGIFFEANGLFLDFSFPLNELNVYKIKERVHVTVKSLNFQKFPKKCRKKINDLVEKLTENKIKDMLKQNIVNKDTSMIVFNALYFNFYWDTPFNKLLTKKSKFTCLCGKESTIDIMGLKRFFFVNHNKHLGIRCLQIPFKGNRFTMVLFLPDKNINFENTIKKLRIKDMEKLITNSVEMEVLLKLPKFKAKCELDNLSKILKNLGVTDMFNFKTANFKKISHADELFVSDVIHTSFVEINERGAEAASCTAAVATFSGPYIPTPTFVCDRPFLFTIRNNYNKNILFFGKVINL